MKSRRIHRSGQSLVEFAVVALVLYMLLAAILTFGHMLYVAQGLQSAADLAAREISRTPLPADLQTLDDDGAGGDALSEDSVRASIFDRAYLVIDLAKFYEGNPSGNVFTDLVPNLPLLNQQLAALMIVDRPDTDGDGEADAWYLRYPGALLSQDPIQPPNGIAAYENYVVTNLTVGIPLVADRDTTGTETIRWVHVIEEIESDANADPFNIESATHGIVALRINYPFQSASMTSFRPNQAGPFEPTIGQPNLADDGSVTEANPADRPGDLITQSLVGDQTYAGTYGGTYGLGAQGALGQVVRPYRRVISAQAIYRREIFSN